MSANEISGKIKGFVGQFVGTEDIDPDTDLFETGMVNSLFAMQLVLFIEKQFGIVVDNEDLDVDNFSSLNAVERFVDRKSKVDC